MKIKTSELSDIALDWAAAFCENQTLGTEQYNVLEPLEEGQVRYSPSTDWAQGGPTLSRLLEGGMLLERCDPAYKNLEKFKASMNLWETTYRGNTPLIAAMRCYVASMLGDEVEIPDELIGE